MRAKLVDLPSDTESQVECHSTLGKVSSECGSGGASDPLFLTNSTSAAWSITAV